LRLALLLNEEPLVRLGDAEALSGKLRMSRRHASLQADVVVRRTLAKHNGGGCAGGHGGRLNVDNAPVDHAREEPAGSSGVKGGKAANLLQLPPVHADGQGRLLGVDLQVVCARRQLSVEGAHRRANRNGRVLNPRARHPRCGAGNDGICLGCWGGARSETQGEGWR